MYLLSASIHLCISGPLLSIYASLDLCVLAISRIEVRPDLGNLEVDGLRVELVVRKPG